MSITKYNLTDLGQFYGTEKWHKILPGVFLTDGAHYVLENANAHWLMILIASHQTNPVVRGEEFQCWNLYLNGGSGCRIECDDGNGNIVCSQNVEYTDFPQDIKLWGIWQDGMLFGQSKNVFTIMLPSEY